MQQLGRDIDPEKARYYIGHKSELGADLRKLGLHKMPEFDSMKWEIFYKSHFSYCGGLEGLHIPQKPDYPCRGVVVVPIITNNRVFDACKAAFKSWRYRHSLDTVTDIVKRPATPYVVWVRDTAEADENLKNKSADDIEQEGLNTFTLKERMLLELAYYVETAKHLDLQNWTLCAGSRYSDGSVPFCGWSGVWFFVYWTSVGYRHANLRSRVAVS
ncbi:MAG: hypothetical protein WCK46_03160 [Candidatus Adlerbacteria bacterium]